MPKQNQSSHLPYFGIRVIELSDTLTGRLTGQLFADQGAEVLFEREPGYQPDEHDEYFDRNKLAVPPGKLSDTSSADIIIIDGDAQVDRLPVQIVMRVTAALPGDEVYGYLPADCSEDFLMGLVGFYTDMGITSRALGRPVIYTPLPLCSVYAGVNGAVATAAALVDRERCGQGREIIASRLAGGLSAIGALALQSKGMPDHLVPADITGIPDGADPEAFKKLVMAASQDAAKQLFLEERVIPLATPYRAADGRLVLPLAAPNRRLTRKFLQHMDIWDEAMATGMVDVSAFDPANAEFIGRNLADSMALNYKMTSKLADLLEAAFAEKTADEWELELNSNGIPCVKIVSWDEWKANEGARTAKIFAQAEGLEAIQLGRSAWVASAQPYPPLQACRDLDDIPARITPLPSNGSGKCAERPLEGYTMVDFANVVAGPNCGRMFSELGATVYKIDPIEPQHSPVIMTTWAAEHGVGKRSIILNMSRDEGRAIMNKIVAKADWVLANKLDGQFVGMGLDREALDKLGSSIIGIQLSAYKGEKSGPRDNHPGYDPVIQGSTGLMKRFGPEGCPTFHGVASCVDYLCGYLGAWAGITALFAREQRQDGSGDWAETSLTVAASLTQCLLQQSSEPETARGAFATGMNDSERVYQLEDGWIFAKASSDLSNELASMSVEDALVKLNDKELIAVPVYSCKELADRHRDQPTPTVNFEQRKDDGWENECFAPSWFAYDGKRIKSPGPASRVGSDGPKILAELGYSNDDIERLIAEGTVGQTEWLPY